MSVYPVERWSRMSRLIHSHGFAQLYEVLRSVFADGALHVGRAGIHEIANQDQPVTNLG